MFEVWHRWLQRQVSDGVLGLAEVRFAQVSVGDLHRAHLQRPGAAHDAGLNGHARDHGQVRVHRRVGLLPKELPDDLPDPWYPGGASNQHYFIHVLLPEVAFRQHGLDWRQDLLEELLVELLEESAGDHRPKENRRGPGAPGGLVAVKVQRHADCSRGVEGEVELGGFHCLPEVMDVLFEGRDHTELLTHSLCGVLEQLLAEVLTPQLVISFKNMSFITS